VQCTGTPVLDWGGQPPPRKKEKRRRREEMKDVL